MTNLIFGIITVIISILLVLLCQKFYKSKRFNLALVCIIICGLVLRIFIGSDMFLHAWDERYHALVAKNILNSPFKPTLYHLPILEYNYKSWTSNHIWLHKQPFSLWSIALSLAVFGKNVIAVRLPSILLSTLGIFVTFRIGKLLFNRKIGFIASFLFAINGQILELGAGRVATDHVDLFFLVLISLAIWTSLEFAKHQRRYLNIISGILIGLSILTKWLPALIVIPIWVLANYHFKNLNKRTIIRLVELLFITMVVALPWQIYIRMYFPVEASWESHYNTMHLYQALERHKHPFYYHFDRMRILFGEIVYIPFLWFIYHCLRKRKNICNWIILTWIIIPYIFFTIAQTKMAGYIMFCSPAIFIMIGYFVHCLQLFHHRHSYKWFNHLLIILCLVLPIRYSIERLKPFHIMDRTEHWIEDLQQLNNLDPHKKKVIFNSKFPIETMFYTDFVAYEYIPPLKTLEKLANEDYHIYIDNKDAIPENLSDLKFVNYTQISGQFIKK